MMCLPLRKTPSTLLVGGPAKGLEYEMENTWFRERDMQGIHAHTVTRERGTEGRGWEGSNDVEVFQTFLILPLPIWCFKTSPSLHSSLVSCDREIKTTQVAMRME